MKKTNTFLMALALASSSACGGGGDSGGAKVCSDASPWREAGAFQSIVKVSVPLDATTPGYGSALAYDASDDTFWGVTDRGPNTAEWKLNLVQLKVTETGVTKLAVVPITDNGTALTGLDLDPEDIVFSPKDGTIWAVDESHPRFVQLSRQGAILQKIDPPARLLDRVTNQGLEGIAISCDGNTLYGILQSGVMAETNKRNTWLVAYDLTAKTYKEYPYLLDDPSTQTYPDGFVAKVGANAMVNLGDNTLLVAERDNGAENSKIKRVYKVVIPATPATTPLAKTLFFDSFAQGYPFAQQEGLAVKDEGRTLYISNDNDGVATNPGEIWIVKF